MSEQIQNLTRRNFDPLVDQPFQVMFGASVLTLDLIECKSLGTRPEAHGQREPFSLIFRGPAEPVLAQRIYPLTHSAIGSVELFLVPLGPAGGGMKYEAIFT